MAKKQIPVRVDAEVLAALKSASQDAGVSTAKYLEGLLIASLKSSGKLPVDFQPSKAQWGGFREKTIET